MILSDFANAKLIVEFNGTTNNEEFGILDFQGALGFINTQNSDNVFNVPVRLSARLEDGTVIDLANLKPKAGHFEVEWFGQGCLFGIGFVQKRDDS